MKANPMSIDEDDIRPILNELLLNTHITICGCWQWNGRLRSGYGTMSVPGKKSSQWVHRVSYAVFKGDIEEDHVIDHRCRNRACINPEHLIMVTHQENCKAIHRRRTRDRQRSIFDILPQNEVFVL